MSERGRKLAFRLVEQWVWSPDGQRNKCVGKLEENEKKTEELGGGERKKKEEDG